MSLRLHSAPAIWLMVFALGIGHLVVDPRVMDISGAPRLLAFALVVGAFLAWSLAARWYEKWDLSVLCNPVVISFAAYAGISAVSILHAVNPPAGVSDIATTIVALVLLCVLAVLLRSWSGVWPVVLRILVATGIVFAGIAWAETITKWGWGMQPRIHMERVEGTMYNGNLHASFLALLVPFSACGTLVLHGLWRWLSLASLVALGAIVLLMQTRAVYLGLCLAIIVGVAVVFFNAPAFGIRRRRRLTLVAVSFAVLAAAFALVYLAPDNPVSSRIRSLAAVAPDSTAAMRLTVWSSTWRMALDHFLTGVGAGNFGIQIHRYYDPSDPAVAAWNPNWTQPHNDFLCVLAEKGLPGLLCLIAVFVFASMNLVRAVRQAHPSSSEAILSSSIIVALVAYAVIAFFDFPLARPGHLFLLSFFLAASAALAPVPAGKFLPEVPRHPARGLALVTFGIILCLLAATQAFLTVRQEWFVRLARHDINMRGWEDAVSHARQARFALNQLDPLGVPVAFHEGLGHLMAGREAEATACFSLAAQQSPYRDYVQHNVAALYFVRGRPDLALQPLQGIVERRKHDPLARFRLAQACLGAGKYTEALEALRNLPPDFEPARVRALREEAERQSAAHSGKPAADSHDG